MEVKDFKQFIDDITKITNNEFQLKTESIDTKNNEFLFRIKHYSNFKQITIDKIKRLYDTYKDDDYQKKAILNDVENLFYKSWDGAYSEITAYDMLNLAFDNPCNIQINNIRRQNTLAKYCSGSNVSEIDGFIEDALMFFEVKTLQNRFFSLMNKIKKEVECYDDNNYFIIESDYPLNLELNGDKNYAALKKEILYARKNKIKWLNSKVVKGLFLKFKYIKEPIRSEFHICENSYEMAQRLERLPLEDYNQFVDGKFAKIFVCNGLNLSNSIICNEEFFRALSRRVFCRLTKVRTVHNEQSKKTTSFIAKRLGGLMYIVDLSANTDKLIKNPRDLYQVYFYTNPNVVKKNKLFDIHHIYSNLNRMKKCACDDFVADNY